MQEKFSDDIKRLRQNIDRLEAEIIEWERRRPDMVCQQCGKIVHDYEYYVRVRMTDGMLKWVCSDCWRTAPVCGGGPVPCLSVEHDCALRRYYQHVDPRRLTSVPADSPSPLAASDTAQRPASG